LKALLDAELAEHLHVIYDYRPVRVGEVISACRHVGCGEMSRRIRKPSIRGSEDCVISVLP
jgi:hypothetical protein